MKSLARMLDAGVVPNRVKWVLEAMGVAESEIAAATKRHRAHARVLHRSFSLVVPTDPLVGKVHTVYRAHARELLDRVAAGEDTRPGTDAECLCLVLDTSLSAPLTATGALVADRLFRRVFGPRARKVPAHAGAEPWPGAVAEQLVELRRRVRVDARVLK